MDIHTASISASMTPLVSVIIPIYNSERWLSETIECLLNQTLHDIEIICIDDGSTDNSADIIRQYCKKDTRVKYSWQNNTGAGAARNKGMTIAKGKYLSFLDADDLYDSHMLEAMSNALEETGAEVCICRVERFDDQTGNTTPFPSIPNNCINGLHTTDSLQPILFQTMLAPWNKLFLRSFIMDNNLQYQNINWTNDVYFVGCALALSHNIYILDNVYVEYRYNTGLSLQDKKYEQPLCGMEAWFAVRGRLLHDDILTIEAKRSLDEASFDALFSYFQKFVNDTNTSRTIFDQLKYTLIDEMRLNSDPYKYLSLKKRLKLWCVERTSFKGLCWACQPVGNGKRYYNKLARAWKNIRLIIAGIIYRDKEEPDFITH